MDIGSGTCTTNGTSHVYAVGDTCTVNVTLTPRFNGPRNGAVQLLGASGQNVATTYIHGIGYGPQIAYLSAPQTNVGNGFSGPISIAVDGNGNIYVASIGLNAIEEFVAADGSTKTLGSGFLLPAGVAVDGAGNVYVADTYNNAVKEILATDGTILTLGSGFVTPSNVAVDGSGNVYVADTGNNAVKEIVAADGSIRTLGSGFNAPAGVAVDGSGNVYVADIDDGYVKEILAVDGSVRAVASGFNLPRDVAIDGIGNVYVTDTYNNEVKEISATDGSIRVIGNGFDIPNGVATDSNGNVYVADYNNDRVVLEGYATVPTLNFATPTQVGSTDTTDGPRSFVLGNIGSAPLTLIAGATGTSPAISTGFSLATGSSTSCLSLSSTSTTATPVASNTSCTYAINFVPTADGPIQGQFVLTDNNTTAYGPATTGNQTILLTGTGLGNPTITVTGTLPAGNVGSGYTGSFNATGGTAPYTFSATGLPSGLSLSTTGSLTGTPSATGTSTIMVTATDASGFTGSAAFTLSVSSAFDFTFAATGTQSQTIAYNGSASYGFTVTPTTGGFPYQVSFTVSGLPAGFAASFSPSPVTPGSSAVNMQLTVHSTTKYTAVQQSGFGFFGVAVAFMLLPFMAVRRIRRRLHSSLLLVLFVSVALVASMGLTGCGQDIINPSSYNLVVTATGGSQQHSASVGLVIKD